jgi:hypothetical protein
MPGYESTILLSQERPDLIPLVLLILEMGVEAFNEGLDELVRRGLLAADIRPPV